MTSVAQALQAFFGGFGLPAYAKNDVPDGAALPYITYEVVRPAPLSRGLLHAWVWVRGNAIASAAAVADAIEAAVRGGASIPTGSGAVCLFPDDHTPFAQEQSTPERAVRVVYLTMAVCANTY